MLAAVNFNPVFTNSGVRLTKVFQLAFQEKKFISLFTSFSSLNLRDNSCLTPFSYFLFTNKYTWELSAESFTILLPLGEHSWGTVKWPLDGGLP